MLKIGIVTGSTRPGRNNKAVAEWVLQAAQARGDAEYELVDIADYGLPLLDEPMPAAMGGYSRPHTLRWAAKIGGLDGFVFVTPEYNHGLSAALKNAIDYLYREWNDKAAGLVSYGANGNGSRAAEHLRGVLAAVKIATVRDQVGLSLFSDFVNMREFQPQPQNETALHAMLDGVVSWGGALQSVREPQLARAAA
ncbi:MAG: NADPH-dependent FMN reductase [Terriglobales bacterium]